jgi:hypothetical protein
MNLEFHEERRLTPERKSELLNLQEELTELTGELKRLEKAGLTESAEAQELRKQILLTQEAMEGSHIEIGYERPPKALPVEVTRELTEKKDANAKAISRLKEKLRAAIEESEKEEQDPNLMMSQGRLSAAAAQAEAVRNRISRGETPKLKDEEEILAGIEKGEIPEEERRVA